MFAQQQLWAKGLKDFELPQARETVVAMLLRIKSKSLTVNLQLMYIDNEEIPRAITNLARDVLVDYWGASIDSEFDVAVDTIFRGSIADFNAATKGWAVQSYFLQCLTKQKQRHPVSLEPSYY